MHNGFLSCSRGTCRRRRVALTYPRDGPLRQTSCLWCFLNIAYLRVVWPNYHSLIFEIRVDVQNDIFGYCVEDLLWCCHYETQTRNEARNSFCKVVLGVQMCMRYMKFVGVYKLKSYWSCNILVIFLSLKTKIKKYVLQLGFELGMAWSTFFSVTICATDLTDV